MKQMEFNFVFDNITEHKLKTCFSLCGHIMACTPWVRGDTLQLKLAAMLHCTTKATVEQNVHSLMIFSSQRANKDGRSSETSGNKD